MILRGVMSFMASCPFQLLIPVPLWEADKQDRSCPTLQTGCRVEILLLLKMPQENPPFWRKRCAIAKKTNAPEFRINALSKPTRNILLKQNPGDFLKPRPGL